MQADNWQKINWKLHLAMQGYFNPGPVDEESWVQPMTDLLEKVHKGKMVNNHEVPPEI